MEQTGNNISACTQDELAFCTAACPFHLDVRDFVGKMQRGGFNAAFRTYQDTVGFPGIISHLCDEPCKNVCPRREKDGSISMRLLEQASLKYAVRTTPNNYNMPSKNKKVAIIGAGISGLACALRLCTKKYEVTVYEKTGRIGGHLWEILPAELFIGDIERQFMYEEYNLCLNTEITNLDELDFDAIYVATGVGGADFGLKCAENGAFASTKPGIFLGGSLMGRSTMEAIADGLHVVKAIERYIKVGSMNSPEEKNSTCIQLNSKRLAYTRPVLPADGAAFTQDEALQEAKRCLRCACDACSRQCDLMRLFRTNPKTIADKAEGTINPGAKLGSGPNSTRLTSSCNQCGLCKKVCPQGIDVGEMILQSHRVMRQKGVMPWAFHDFWLRDMEFTNGPDAQLSRIPVGYDQSSYMFFPGCQLGASDFRYVTASYRWLLANKPDTALMLSCCGAPAKWAGDEPLHEAVITKLRKDWVSLGKPIAVFACPTCKQMFGEYLPEIEGVFLYDLIVELGISPSTDPAGELVSIFDPCSSREEPELQQEIRQLMKQSGFCLEPLSMEGEFAQCCGWGGQVSIANPPYFREVVKTRVVQNDKPYITYCVNCRDIFAAAQKPVYHILDILFGLNNSSRLPPTFTERRSNRISLKRQALNEFWREEVKVQPKESQTKLHVSAQVRQKISNAMILETDIEAVIEHCESSGVKGYNPENGHYTGYLKIGNMTYWAEYFPVDKGYELVNAYSHRMSIEEA